MFGLLALLLAVSPPHFHAAPGWHVGSSRAKPCEASSPARCVWAAGWASTVPYRDCPNCIAPHRTLAHLPPDGIVIQLTNVRERPLHMRPGTWPPRVRARDVTGPFEGEPRRFGVFQFTVRTGTVERSLFVWFGRMHPTARQLARANAELRTVS
jgi:hypothetical protein